MAKNQYSRNFFYLLIMIMLHGFNHIWFKELKIAIMRFYIFKKKIIINQITNLIKIEQD